MAMTEELLAQQYDVRDALLRDLSGDLLGPESHDETIVDAPITRYIVGVLYPQSSDALAPELDHDVADGDEDQAAPDPGVALAHVRYPSSMGFSFALDSAFAGTIRVDIRCGRYEQIDDEPGHEAAAAPTRARRAEGENRPWRRVDINSVVMIAIGEPDMGTRRRVHEGLEVFSRIRRARDSWAVTLALINTNRVPAGSVEKDSLSFFQAALHVTVPGVGPSPFVERPMPGGLVDDADVRSYSLLYRHSRTYAIGHGCGVAWNIGGDSDFIETSYIPTHELLLAASNPNIDLPCLDLDFLAGALRQDVIAALEALPSGYRSWIADQRATDVGGAHARTAAEHLDDCESACVRMEAGIDQLAHGATAWEAFRFANAAMLTVRARSEWHRAGRPEAGPSEAGHRWYPFQLAFILLCLPGIIDPSRDDRKSVDLLWFPTGGGKTEAYLGLIAFTVFLRRLRNQEGGRGVTALMRYTLRLLTIQQFERAAALIVACEMARRGDPATLGSQPISLGLWVGQAGTPNDRATAQAQLKKLRAGVAIEQGNPVQLKSCPWCGTRLDESNYYLNRDRNRLIIACPDRICPFTEGLPIVVVDDDIYDVHPTLIIATADKFASIAWREEAHRLFNLDLSGVLPPELIIQDELHLISGPLGTLAGLYEAAIDGTAGSKGTPPKVVASTATIRRADAQTVALFARPVRQFPPPGIDARDSFFAVESARIDKGSRLYVGLLAPGTSQTTLLVRTYARLLQSAEAIPESDAAKDPYRTLLGYFNSLRVLGGARMQVHNDVEDRLKLLEADDDARRRVDRVIELTSRESSADIPGYLEQLGQAGPDALDVVLATNMISVGVDIDRLGLMVVMGQPQGTAEYIQATSRVGRKFPGMVVVLLNAARSRDRSHYEAFSGYHGALYRQVESSSVTPYSPRARDRALHAALIASVRMRIPELRANERARDVDSQLGRVLAIRDELVDRARIIAPADAAETGRQLNEIIDRWCARARENPKLKYRDQKDPESALLVAASDPEAGDPEKGNPYGTLWSLRDVDRSSNLYLLR
jgi:hypothetical protein